MKYCKMDFYFDNPYERWLTKIWARDHLVNFTSEALHRHLKKRHFSYVELNFDHTRNNWTKGPSYCLHFCSFNNSSTSGANIHKLNTAKKRCRNVVKIGIIFVQLPAGHRPNQKNFLNPSLYTPRLMQKTFKHTSALVPSPFGNLAAASRTNVKIVT